MGKRLTAALLALTIALPAQQQTPKFEATTNLVVVNVTVRDKSGKPVEGLKKEDFVVLEDGKPQAISVFEFQRLSNEVLSPMPKDIAPKEEKDEEEQPDKPPAPGELRYKDRRLLVLFFDMSSMKVEDQIRAQEAALKFLDQQMTKSDLVSMMTFTSSLKLDVDFTEDREQIAEAIRDLPIGEMSEFAEGPDTTAEEEDEEDPNTLFVADMTEFNIFNTDRKLSALESAARHLSTLPEKKALVYFSSGVGKTGVENQSQLRATVNEAIKANVAFYPIDARGLIATPPAGDATKGTERGTGIFSGKTQRERHAKINDQQETLYSLAADTGGKALLDTNELTLGIAQAQKDVDSYYILGYYSSNAAQDGRFRSIRVRIPSQPQAKLDHRAGYYASKLYKNFNAADKERQLEEALQAGASPTDIPMALEANYFRLSASRYFVPVALKVPGSALATAKKGAADVAELDFIGYVRDLKGKTAASVRDTIRVKADAAKLARRALLYDTGFVLAPGKYRLKFLSRDNQTGKMGTFETRLTVPDLGADESLRMSSVVWAHQREPLAAAIANAGNSKKVLANHPLIRDGQKLVPSITHVFRKGQNLYVYFEVYDPGPDPGDKMPDVAASLSIFHGNTKAYESAPVRVTHFAAARPQTVTVQFQLPLAKLHAGRYTCQINAVDAVGRKFAFARSPLVLMP